MGIGNKSVIIRLGFKDLIMFLKRKMQALQQQDSFQLEAMKLLTSRGSHAFTLDTLWETVYML